MNILIGCVKSTSSTSDTIMDESHRTDLSHPNSIPKITIDADKKGELGGHDVHFNRLCEEHVLYG